MARALATWGRITARKPLFALLKDLGRQGFVRRGGYREVGADRKPGVDLGYHGCLAEVDGSASRVDRCHDSARAG